MSRLLRTISIIGLLVAMMLPLASTVLAEEPFPPCDAAHDGDTWTDPQSGDKYICLLDPENGFWWWHPTGPSGSHRESVGFTYASSSYGCAWNIVSTWSDYYGAPTNGAGSAILSRFYSGSPACSGSAWVQPINEMRARTVIQRWNGSIWATISDSGYQYNNVSGTSWLVGLNMGSVPDGGPGTYRTLGYGSYYQGGAWRGTSRISPSLYEQ
jgi:hypothetical protein